jgi:hypothetical protein
VKNHTTINADLGLPGGKLTQELYELIGRVLPQWTAGSQAGSIVPAVRALNESADENRIG